MTECNVKTVPKGNVTERPKKLYLSEYAINAAHAFWKNSQTVRSSLDGIVWQMIACLNFLCNRCNTA